MINLVYHEAKKKEEEVMKYGREPDFKFSSMPEFSRRVGGLNRKKLVVVGARPSNGKTAFALSWAFDIARDHSVLFLSLESDTSELIIRLFCSVCDISNEDIEKNGVKFYKDKWDWFLEMLKGRKLLIADNVGASWQDILSAIEHDYKFDVLFLDYIQCVSKKGMVKLEAIEEYVKELRVMAIKHDFCAVILSQINRQNVEKDPKPTMTGLKNCGFLEEHADKCFLLHWAFHHTHDNADLNNLEVILAKNKSGRTGISTIKFYPERYKFTDFVVPKRSGYLENSEVAWDD